MALAKEVVNQAGAMREFEKPEVCKAIKVANANKLIVGLSPAEWFEREARLKKEFEERSNATVPGKEQPEEKKRIICWSASPKADFYYKHVLNEGNPALKESASQFNDALLDEQAKEIDKQNKEITRLLSLVEKKENSISRLYYEKSVLEKENEELKKGEIPARYFDKALVDEQSEKIKKLEHEKLDILEIASSSKQTITEQADKIKRLGKEISKLNSIIHDKNAVLSDVAEELRLTKIREKNLAELGLKYVGENEKLKKELADKVVDKIDAQALKSAERALAYKEKVIADLQEKLAATKNELDAFKESYKRRIKEDLEHFEHIQKICNAGLQKWLIESEYLEKDKPFRFSQLPELSEEEENKLEHAKKNRVSSDHAEEGADLYGVIVLCGKDFVDALKKVKDVWQE